MTTRTVPGWRLSHRLQRAREHANLDQAQLAERIGVSRQSVSNYERGLRIPTAALIESWSEATNVDADWIREGESDRSEADDLVDQIAAIVALRARRDSNPQPSDP